MEWHRAPINGLINGWLGWKNPTYSGPITPFRTGDFFRPPCEYGKTRQVCWCPFWDGENVRSRLESPGKCPIPNTNPPSKSWATLSLGPNVWRSNPYHGWWTPSSWWQAWFNLSIFWWVKSRKWYQWYRFGGEDFLVSRSKNMVSKHFFRWIWSSSFRFMHVDSKFIIRLLGVSYNSCNWTLVWGKDWILSESW